ncbi:MAG: rhodanese-like domain-containing protein [Burkholderiaceae bacterium]
MKFIVDNWMLFTVAIGSASMLFWPMVKDSVTSSGALSPNAAVQLINREKAVVIDVSEVEEFAAGHIGGSKNIPVSDMDAKLASMVKNKALPLIMVCPKGARATRAQGMAKKLGFDNVQVLAGGLNAWKAANLPIEKA